MCSSAAEPESRTDTAISFWRDVRLALRGHECDLTRESARRAILLLAVPMVLETFMASLFAIVDLFWVSRLGADAIAVVGLTESVMGLIYALAVGLSVAATAIISRRTGERDPERAARSAAQFLILGSITAILIGVVLGYFAVDVLELLGGSPATVELGSDYARIMFGCNATAFLIFIINAIFRGAGDAVLAMRTLWLANALNILLAPCLIFGWGPLPEMGVTGAAIATTIARAGGLTYQLWHLTAPTSRTRVRLRHFKQKLEALPLALSASAMAQPLIISATWLALFKILATYGPAAVAAYTISLRIVVFALLPAYGIGSAAATLVGQNLGARRPDQAEAAVRVAGRLNVFVLTAIGVLLLILAEPLTRLFATDTTLASDAATALRISTLAFPMYAIGICLSAAFNGAGDTWTPTRTSFMCFWLGGVPLAWLLSSVLHLGPVGVYIAVPAASSSLAIFNYALFKRGTWKLRML